MLCKGLARAAVLLVAEFQIVTPSCRALPTQLEQAAGDEAAALRSDLEAARAKLSSLEAAAAAAREAAREEAAKARAAADAVAEKDAMITCGDTVGIMRGGNATKVFATGRCRT